MSNISTHKKQYTYSETLPTVASVVNKIRSLEALNRQEELVYLMHIKGISEEAANKAIDNKE